MRSTLTLSICLSAALLVACPSDPPAPKPADAGESRVEVPEPPADTGHAASASRVVAAIEALETTKDVTCWTSFRQLDFFVATRQYSAYATLTKIASIKALTRNIWRQAAEAAEGNSVTAADIEAAATLESVSLPAERREALGDLAGELGLKAYNDYRTTSEHWRVVLSLVQDALRVGDETLKPLDPGGAEALTESATKLSLELLVTSGELAVIAKSPFIEASHVRAAHQKLADKYGLGRKAPVVDKAPGSVATEAIAPVTGALIDAKIKALRQYNASEGSIQADLQRISRLPLDKAGVDKLVALVTDFARFVTEGREPMRADNYLVDGSAIESKNKAPQRDYIDVVYVENTLAQRFPHLLMANGDILLRFEPNPGNVTRQAGLEAQELRLLDHQMNGVRDTALHWLVLQRLHRERPFAMDPFAAEILSEVVSMVATLYIRRAQTITRQMKKPAVDAAAVSRVKTKDFVMVPPRSPEPPQWNPDKKARKATLLAKYPEALFEDVTQASGLPHDKLDIPEGSGRGDIQTVMGAGIALGDLNGDGYPDLFMAGEGLGKLYMNKGKAAPGQFEDKSAAWGIPTGMMDTRGALFFDREGDGDLDLLVLRSHAASLLLDNQGGAFVDVSAKVGFEPGKGAHVASIFDYDADGDLDIYVGFYGADACNRGDCLARNLPSLDGLNGTPNQLWRLDGARYTEVGAEAGVANTGWTLAAQAFDHDNDGDLDLHIANDFGANNFFENQGGGRFSDVSGLTGTADRGSGMNVSVTDVNADGNWDFYITNIDMFSKNIKVVFPTDEKTLNIDDATLRSFRYISGNKLYVRQRDGRYQSEEASRFEPGDRGWSWAGVFFDLENDGDEDLYLSNGWIEGSYAQGQKNQLFIHHGGDFFLAAPGSPEAFAGNSRSVVASDLDRDGDQDLVVNNFRQPPVVLRNTQSAGHRWLGLKLEGKAPNTRAIGARITVSAGSWRAARQISCGGDYLGQQDGALIIGAGAARTVSVKVVWPSGATQSWDKVATNQWKTLEQSP